MFCSKSDHFTGNLSTNTIKHVSDIELYITLSTLEKFECWNQNFNHELSAGETVSGARSSRIVHIGRLYEHKINTFNYFTQQHWQKELSSDVAPHPKESSTLTVKNGDIPAVIDR